MLTIDAVNQARREGGGGGGVAMGASAPPTSLGSPLIVKKKNYQYKSISK